jgi:hypothetical protein
MSELDALVGCGDDATDPHADGSGEPDKFRRDAERTGQHGAGQHGCQQPGHKCQRASDLSAAVRKEFKH